MILMIKKFIKPIACLLVFAFFIVNFYYYIHDIKSNSPTAAFNIAVKSIAAKDAETFRKVVDIDSLSDNLTNTFVIDYSNSSIDKEFLSFTKQTVSTEIKNELKAVFDYKKPLTGLVESIKTYILPKNGFSYKVNTFEDKLLSNNIIVTVLLKDSNMLLSFVIETKKIDGQYKIINIKNIKEMLQFVIESQKYSINLKNSLVQKEFINSLPLIELKTAKTSENETMLTYTLQNKTDQTIKSFYGSFVDDKNNLIFNVESSTPLAQLQTFGNTLKIKSDINEQDIKFNYKYVEFNDKKLYLEQNNIKLFKR